MASLLEELLGLLYQLWTFWESSFQVLLYQQACTVPPPGVMWTGPGGPEHHQNTDPNLGLLQLTETNTPRPSL